MDDEKKSSMLDLPAELRVLAKFLEEDDRPTLVLGRTKDGGKVHYGNPAFVSLGVQEDDIGRAACAVEISGDDALASNGNWIDVGGRRWQRRSLGDEWTALTCEPGRHSTESPSMSNGIEPAQAPEINSPAASCVDLEMSPVGLDWIKHPTPDLSPWQKFILDHDWSSTPIGPISTWPTELRTVVLAMMANPVPQVLYIGPERIFVYNEAWVPLFGQMHPTCLGKRNNDIWSDDILQVIEPYAQTALQGKAGTVKQLPVYFSRNGYLEETYWDALLTPCLGPQGTPIAILSTLSECSKMIRGERRRATVSSIRDRVSTATTLAEVWNRFSDGLGNATIDAPWALLFSAEHEGLGLAANDTNGAGETTCTLEGTVGLDDLNDVPCKFRLGDETLPLSAKTIAAAINATHKGRFSVVDLEDASLPEVWSQSKPDRGFGDAVKQAVIMPIHAMNHKDQLQGVLVLGLCARCPLDDEYNLWISVLGDVLMTAAAVIAIPMEQQKSHKDSVDLNESLSQQLRRVTLEAERSDAKFSRMARLSPVGMFIVDPDGRPLYLNDAYRNLIPGASLDDFHQAEDWSKWIHPDDIARFWEAWNRVVTQKVPSVVQHRILQDWVSVDKNSGDEITGETWLLATSFPEVEPDGHVSAVMGWITDISAAKRAEHLVAKRLEDVLETKRQSENFIDMTSHEMRNPLSAILQSADSIISTLQASATAHLDDSIILSNDNAKDLADSAQTILLCAQHQKRIVDDILTLSKLDASLLIISPDRVQLPELVSQALRMYDGELGRADIHAWLNVEPTYDELQVDWVMLDPSRMLQVIINLLTNAIKFTQYSDMRDIKISIGASYGPPTGAHHGVQFIPRRHAKRAQSPPSEQWGTGEDIYLQVAVTDTGHGLSEDDMQVLFKRFAQASPKTYGQYGGSGLGLFISRELCELQGGQIGVCSHGRKTTFTFYVKARRCTEEPDGGMASLQRVVSNSFVSAAPSPVVFGRRGSSYATPKTKPRDPSSNHEQKRPIPEVTEVVANGAPIPDEAIAATDEHLHVLIVEDNLINQKVMSQQLRKAGLTVHVANHGVECLDFVGRSSFSSPPPSPVNETSDPLPTITPLSVILLDLEMPTMDGLTCIRHLRERQLQGEISSHIPVIAVTANARSEQIAHAIEAGMDEVVTKPFRIPELVPQMRRLVAEIKRRGTG